MNRKNVIITIISVLVLTCLLTFARTTTTDLGLVKPTWEEEDPEYDILVDLNANTDIIEAFANDPLEFDTGERLEDRVGAMWTGNAETLIALTYQDADNTIDAVIDDDLSKYDNTTSGFMTATLTQEQVDDFVYALISDTDSVHTRITITYDDADDAFDFVVDDLDTNLTEEEVEDYIGGMLGGTETLISVDYQDDTNDIDFVVTIPEDYLTATMLKDDNAPADEDIFCYELTGTTGHWYSRAEVGIGVATSITDGLILEADLNADEEPTDNDILTFDTTGANFSWQTIAELGIQPLDASLTSIAALTYASDSFIKMTAEDTYAVRTIAEVITDLALSSDNLSDVASIAMLDENETVTGFWIFTNYFNIFRANDSYSPNLIFERLRDGDPTDNVSSGDCFGRITFHGYHTDSYEEGAIIRAMVDGTPGSGDMPGRLEFLTTPDGSDTPSLRMAIDNAGNIKMGDGAWTNYINVSAAGALTFVGTASINIPDDTIVKADFANEDWGDMTVSSNTVTLDGDVVDSAEIADNAIDSEHYTDGSIDHEHLAADAFHGLTADTLADADEFAFYDATETALNKITWTNLMGSITKLGTIGTGTWEGTAIADGYIPNNITIDLSTLATTFTCTDNESEALACPIVFVDGATGAQGAETDDTDFTYNPSTGTIKVTALDLTTALPDAEVANNITIDLATLATTITVTDNESTNEENPICFVAGADPDGGSLGIETDGTMTYNPSTGVITTTGFAGALTGNVTGNASGSSGSCTGLAATATALATGRNIGGVSFDGTAAITPIYLSLDHALGSDEDYVGITDTVTVGYTTAIGDLMYFDWTATEWLEAQADAFATTPAMRIALEVKSDGQECLALVQGYIRDDDAFDFGAARIFLNDDTAGLCDDTAPAESGDQIQVVGIGITADILYFNPSIDVGEI